MDASSSARAARALLSLLFCVLLGCAHAHGSPSSSPRADGTALSPDQMIAIAHELERRGDPQRAQQYVRRAISAGAPEGRLMPWLLRLCVADGQYRLAADYAEDYLRSHPEADELRLLLAALYEAVGRDAAAIEQYERVLARHPDEARAHFALATLLHDGGLGAAEADAHYRAYLALEPHGTQAAEARALLLKELP